ERWEHMHGGEKGGGDGGYAVEHQRAEPREGATEPGDHAGRRVAPLREHAGGQRERVPDRPKDRAADVGRRAGQAAEPVVYHAPAVTRHETPQLYVRGL